MMRKWLPALMLLVCTGWAAAVPVPMPKEFFFAGRLDIDLNRPVGYSGAGAKRPAELLAGELSRWSGVRVKIAPGAGSFRLVEDRALQPGHYTIEGETLTGGDERALFDAVETVLGALGGADAVWSPDGVEIPVLMIQDSPGIPWRAIRWDGLAREPQGLRAAARLKYNVLLMPQADPAAVLEAEKFGFQVVPEVTDWAAAEAWVTSGLPIREMFFAGEWGADIAKVVEFGRNHGFDVLVGMEGATVEGMLTLVYSGDGERRRFPELEQLRREGKRIVFAPRTPEDARLMAKSAALYGCGIIAPAWNDAPETGDTLVALAEYAWNPYDARVPYALPTLSVWYELLHDRERRVGGECRPVTLPVNADGDFVELNYKGVPFRLAEPLLLGSWPDGDFDGTLENTLAGRLPLAVQKDGLNVATIRHLNETPGFDDWSLFTRNYGSSTRTDIDYGEVRIVDGTVTQVAEPGTGDMRIPRCGAVLARRDWTPEWGVGEAISVVGSDGRPVDWYAAQAMHEYPASAVIELADAPLTRLHFWHDTGIEAASGAIVDAELEYTDGSVASLTITAPEMIAAADSAAVASSAWAATTDGSEFNRDSVDYAWTWENPHPDKTPRQLRLSVTENGRRAGYRLWALTAEH